MEDVDIPQQIKNSCS